MDVLCEVYLGEEFGRSKLGRRMDSHQLTHRDDVFRNHVGPCVLDPVDDVTSRLVVVEDNWTRKA